jgi:hypothetical protein
MFLNQRSTLKPPKPDLDPHPIAVVPSGYYGAGIWTAHPIGLFIVSALILVGVWGIPEARGSFAGVAPLAALCGYLLWRAHTRCGTAHPKIFPAN